MKLFSAFLGNRKYLLFLIDAFLCIAISLFSLLLSSPDRFGNPDRVVTALILTGCIMLARTLGHIYRKVWRYARVNEYVALIISDYIGGLIYLIITHILFDELIGRVLPLNISVWQAIAIVAVNCLASVLMRSVYQILYGETRKHQTAENAVSDVSVPVITNKINAAVVGAGSVGTLLVNELRLNTGSHYEPYCFIDTDPQKIGKSVSGIRVFGEDGIIEKLKTLPVQEVIIALPNLSNEEKVRIFTFYKQSNCKVKLYDFPFAEARVSSDVSNRRMLREFEIEDLLFRDPIALHDQKTSDFYRNKVVLITGGGGSIGSELSRQIASFSPKRLIILDIYENNAYDIQQELLRKYGKKLDLCIEISSVREEKRVNAVFAKYHPDIVLHAAAHKHVPLMEHNPAETIKNNIFGTYNVANAAEKYGCSKFILISTDKAVNPTNIMGASKRVCEMIVQSRHDSATSFAAVRFGNVLGSNGSVIPLFKRQIASGGPVTITDKRIIRYFMTIPEAAQLVLQAGSMARKGELFVLDMGKPVKILELAENMIRLSGFEPYVDIDIKEVGLREGEKLYEELLIKSEELDKTPSDLIFIERDKAPSRPDVESKLAILRGVSESCEPDVVKSAFKVVVPTYRDPEEVNQTAEKAPEMIAVTTVSPAAALTY